jgi:hypothetical protein
MKKPRDDALQPTVAGKCDVEAVHQCRPGFTSNPVIIPQ